MAKADQEHQRQSKGPDVTGVYTEGYLGWAFPGRLHGKDSGGGLYDKNAKPSDLTSSVFPQELIEDSPREQRSRQN